MIQKNAGIPVVSGATAGADTSNLIIYYGYVNEMRAILDVFPSVMSKSSCADISAP